LRWLLHIFNRQTNNRCAVVIERLHTESDHLQVTCTLTSDREFGASMTQNIWLCNLKIQKSENIETCPPIKMDAKQAEKIEEDDEITLNVVTNRCRSSLLEDLVRQKLIIKSSFQEKILSVSIKSVLVERVWRRSLKITDEESVDDKSLFLRKKKF